MILEFLTALFGVLLLTLPFGILIHLLMAWDRDARKALEQDAPREGVNLARTDEPRTVESMWIVSRSATWLILSLFASVIVLAPAMMSLIALEALPPLAAFAIVSLILGALVAEAHSRVTIGSDGISIRRYLRAHYIPFSNVAEVCEVDGVAIRMILRSGTVVDLRTGKDEQVFRPKYATGCEHLLTRIQSGIRRSRSLSDLLSDPSTQNGLRERAHLALRGGEPLVKSPFRVAPAPDSAELMRLVESEGSTPSTRGAAAVLLHLQGTDEHRQRLRVACDATAHPLLRRVFRVASESTEPDVLEEALRELEQERGSL